MNEEMLSSFSGGEFTAKSLNENEKDDGDYHDRMRCTEIIVSVFLFTTLRISESMQFHTIPSIIA